MSRVLRQGTDVAREGPLRLNRRDGASALVREMVAHSAFQKLRATKDDIIQCASSRGRSSKMRFDFHTAADGDRVRAFQGRTVEAEPCIEHTRTMSQRFALHATQVASARRIAHEGFKLLTGRREFHFAEARFNTRQANYLRDSSGQRGVCLLIDMHKAMLGGIEFRLMANDVVVSRGKDHRIPADCIVSIWGGVDKLPNL